jgi:predicted ester cyclase
VAVVSSPDAAKLLLAYLTAGDAADYDRFEAVLAENVIVHSPGGAASVGVEAQRESWQAAHRGLRDLSHSVQHVVSSADTASARVVVSGVHTGPFLGVEPTGSPITVDAAVFVRVAGGRIVELWEIVDTGAGLTQLGVLSDQRLAP